MPARGLDHAFSTMPDPGPEKREVLPRGTIVAQRFRIDCLLGAGGMASVYRADDLKINRAVALKLLRKDLCETPEALLRFRRECELLTALAHPSIVRVESYGEVGDGSLFLAMELLEGESLGQFLRREKSMEPRELASLLAGVGAGLIAAHANNVVHRDLKPDNIFLARTAGSSDVQVKLLDFGISKVFGSERLTMTGQVLGTPRYMSPEQLTAETNLDTRVDIYALGVILYEAIAGQPPFLAVNASDMLVAILHGEAVPLRSVKPDVPEAVAAVVMRAMSRLPDARFAKVADLVDAYIHAVGHEAVKKPARRGMPTRVVGSFGFSEPPAPKSGSFEKNEVGHGGALRPGTLAEIPEVNHSQGLRAPTAAPLPVAPKKAMPSTQQQDQSQFAEPARVYSAAVAQAFTDDPTPNIGPDPSVNLPMAGNHSMVIVAAIVAGALSAGIAIFGLSHCGRRSTESEAAPGAGATAAPYASTTIVPVDAAIVDASTAELPQAADLPIGVEPPAPTAVRGEHRRVAGSHEARPTSPPATPEVAPAAPAPATGPTGLDLMNQARAAQRASDFDGCVTLARQALEQGAPSAALRIQGDCLRRGGHGPEALTAYQRFCRVAPDHPAIGEVRALAEGLGGTCP